MDQDYAKVLLLVDDQYKVSVTCGICSTGSLPLFLFYTTQLQFHFGGNK